MLGTSDPTSVQEHMLKLFDNAAGGCGRIGRGLGLKAAGRKRSGGGCFGFLLQLQTMSRRRFGQRSSQATTPKAQTPTTPPHPRSPQIRARQQDRCWHDVIRGRVLCIPQRRRRGWARRGGRNAPKPSVCSSTTLTAPPHCLSLLAHSLRSSPLTNTIPPPPPPPLSVLDDGRGGRDARHTGRHHEGGRLGVRQDLAAPLDTGKPRHGHARGQPGGL